MISQSAEYSLRAVICLAGNSQRPLTIREVAERTHVPAGYLAKILNLLHRAGIVSAQRGLRGGYTLARNPAQLTLLDVVRISDPSARVHRCPLGICGTNLCAMHRRIDQAAAAAESALADSTVADVLPQTEVLLSKQGA